MLRLSQLAVVACSFATFNVAAQANVVVNGGFETPGEGGIPAAGWTIRQASGPQSSSYTRSTTEPASGSAHAILSINSFDSNGAEPGGFVAPEIGIQQEARGLITGGETYTLSAVAKLIGTLGIGAVLDGNIHWLDVVDPIVGGGGFLGQASMGMNSVNGSYQTFTTGPIVAPANADTAVIYFHLRSGPFAGADTTIYLDNVSLTAVPEPASLALMTLGGLLIGRRRRA